MSKQRPDLFAERTRAGYEGAVARMVLPTPVDREFDYVIPDLLAGKVRRGCRATVPFGKRSISGFVVQVLDSSPLPRSKLKELMSLHDEVPLADEGILRLTRWMAEHYACSWGEALEAVIPAVVRQGKVRRTVAVLRLARKPDACAEYALELERASKGQDNSPRTKQARVLRTLLAFEPRDFRMAELAETLGFSLSPIQTLMREGWVTVERIPMGDPFEENPVIPASEGHELNVEQESALERIVPCMDRDEYHTFLLKGVTGSGKTEVYIRALEHALKAGKSGIVLVPEIALTPQTVKRFSERLGHASGIAILHSAMTDARRRTEWKRIVSGEARVVIGPRSAVFAPVRDLGLIVVDEEHEATYKQDNVPRYHARDVAVMRCHQNQAVCLLGSATPSLESAFNAGRGKYTLLEMRRRVADRRLPKVVVVDMSEECRVQRRFTHLSRALMTALTDALREGRQAVMFLNRRGYNTFFQCDACRTVLSCPHCDVPMSLHAALGQAVCHYCYELAPRPNICGHCRRGSMVALGVGTELLEQDMRMAFPSARVARMDSDVMKKREDYEDVLDRFRDGEVDILVGTQMIAKGLDFPNVTVVGVVHADLNLYLADFRAQERTFQLLTQVAGRAGRGEHPGMVFVQTFTPLHPCIVAAQAQDYWSFYEHELRQRKLAEYPPFTRLLNVTVEARDRERGQKTAHEMRSWLDDLQRMEPDRIRSVLGPAVAPFARLRGRFRFQVLAKVRDHESMALVSERMRQHAKSSESLRIILDVDPYSML